jgi:hypothetical protein
MACWLPSDACAMRPSALTSTATHRRSHRLGDTHLARKPAAPGQKRVAVGYTNDSTRCDAQSPDAARRQLTPPILNASGRNQRANLPARHVNTLLVLAKADPQLRGGWSAAPL